MRVFLGSLFLCVVVSSTARADFQWLGSWQAIPSITQTPPETTASATFGDVNASITTASMIANQHWTQGGPRDAEAVLTFSRAFQLSGDSGPTTVMLVGTANGKLSVDFSSPFAGSGQARYGLQMGITGQGSGLSLWQFIPGPATPNPLIVNDSQIIPVVLNDGTYTLTGSIDVWAFKSSGLTPSLSDFSGPQGFVFGLNPVPEPSADLLFAAGLAFSGLWRVKRIPRARGAITGRIFTFR